MPKKPMKRFSVDIDKISSDEIIVKAGTPRDAKKKAWGKFIKRKPKRKHHTIYVQEL